jgi:hypothetical protein
MQLIQSFLGLRGDAAHKEGTAVQPILVDLLQRRDTQFQSLLQALQQRLPPRFYRTAAACPQKGKTSQQVFNVLLIF